MDDSGRNASTGLLDETNFDEWIERMHRMLSTSFPGSRIDKRAGDMVRSTSGSYIRLRELASRSSNYSYSCWFSCEPEDEDEVSAEFATILRWQVNPHMRSRILRGDGDRANSLLRALRRMACPFRFMDLPPELRIRVYRLALPSTTRSRVAFPYRPGRSRFHNASEKLSLLSVSNQVRAETLPLYYRRRDLILAWPEEKRMTFGRSSSMSIPTKRISDINRWAAMLRSDSLKQLRCLTVQRPRRRAHAQTFRLELIKVEERFDLRIQNDGSLGGDAQQALTEHATVISSTAQSLKLEGEALLLFFTSRSEIWSDLIW